MPRVRIPKETWHKVWKTLLQEGAVTRVSEDYIYLISERHLLLYEVKESSDSQGKAIAIRGGTVYC